MQDFLLFKTFITPSLLLFFYYTGALLIPLLSWYFAVWVHRNYLSEVSGLLKEEIKRRTTVKQRLYTVIAFVLCFLCLEIFWRILFELFIAYFDMHDALLRIS